MDQIREVIRHYECGERTERIYVKWILEFIRFNGLRHPSEMGKQEIERFLSHLSVNKRFATAAQEEAKNAILYLYREVMDSPLDDQICATTPDKPTHLQAISSRGNVAPLLFASETTEFRIMAG